MLWNPYVTQTVSLGYLWCKRFFFSTSFLLNDSFSVTVYNSFGSLSSPSSPGPPLHSTTPTIPAPPGKKPVKRKLKVVSLNCNGLKGFTNYKTSEFHSMLHRAAPTGCNTGMWVKTWRWYSDLFNLPGKTGWKGFLRDTGLSVFDFRERWKHEIEIRELWMVCSLWYVSFKICYPIIVIFNYFLRENRW